MRCVEKGCDASQKVRLMLCPSGRFVVSAVEGDWQVSAVNGDGPYMCRCPAHHRKVTQLAGTGPSIVDASGQLVAR
jgi:hypothetical protein